MLFQIELFLYFGLQTVLYLHSDSIHHGYLNKTGIVTVTKFNMNMVRKALNLMLVRWQLAYLSLSPLLSTTISSPLKIRNFKIWRPSGSEIRNLKCDLFKMSSVLTNNFLPECSLDIVG